MIYRPDYMDALKAFKDKPLVKILTGVRRCGKSTIFQMFKEELIREGVSQDHIIEKRYTDMDIPESITATRREGTKDGLIGCELEGKKFGVVGTGAIGMNVARIAAAFGCEVLAYSRTKKEMDNVRYVSLDELMAESDIISLHVPSNAETKGLISAEKIALMKPNAVLINTARGPVLDSQALADALNNDKIAGACIDVFETEPPIAKTHPLVNAKHTILTPHVAFASKEAMVKRAVIVFDNVVKYLNGTPQNIM